MEDFIDVYWSSQDIQQSEIGVTIGELLLVYFMFQGIHGKFYISYLTTSFLCMLSTNAPTLSAACRANPARIPATLAEMTIIPP